MNDKSEVRQMSLTQGQMMAAIEHWLNSVVLKNKVCVSGVKFDSAHNMFHVDMGPPIPEGS